jgi:hypothetical protein
MFGAVLVWGLAELFVEDAREVALVGEAGIHGDLHDAQVGFSQELGGAVWNAVGDAGDEFAFGKGDDDCAISRMLMRRNT